MTNDLRANFFLKTYLSAMSLALLMACLLGIGGCINLLPTKTEVHDQIALDHGPPLRDILPEPVSWQLTIERPTCLSLYNTDEIVALVQGYDYGYVSGLRWIDTPPNMVQTSLIRAFQDSDAILGVGTGQNALYATYSLLISIRSFEVGIDDDGHPVAAISLDCRLLNIRQRQIVAQRTFAATCFIDTHSVKETADGFNISYQKVVKDIVSWVLLEGEALFRETPAQATSHPKAEARTPGEESRA